MVLNGVEYRRPSKPVVVICIDGGDPEYIDAALSVGCVPNIARFIDAGFNESALSVVPSLTNPNNISITTGSAPDVHGISGNYILEPESNLEVMMDDPRFLRSESILSSFSNRGAKVAIITAKDKLRNMLGANVDIAGGSIVFSAEKADACRMDANGIEKVPALVGLPVPEVYSADLSLFVLKSGREILKIHRPDVMYLSLSDYIQHKYAPGTPASNAFYAEMDRTIGEIADTGAIIGITADHGMSDKSNPDGTPNVVYLQDALDTEFGYNSTRVILPITDPYVVHHGALGGFARIYCLENGTAEKSVRFSFELPGVEAVYDKFTACRIFELPYDREGDLVVIADGNTVIGTSASKHDLSQLEGFRLRSHGGISESEVPFILSEPVRMGYAKRSKSKRLHNYDIFDFALNGTR